MNHAESQFPDDDVLMDDSFSGTEGLRDCRAVRSMPHWCPAPGRCPLAFWVGGSNFEGESREINGRRSCHRIMTTHE